jgi:hypothetical protein
MRTAEPIRGRRWLAAATALLTGVVAMLLAPAAPVAAATQFSDGFESGTLAAWGTTASFSPVSDPTAAYAGSWYGLASTSAGSAYAQASLASAQSEVYVGSAIEVISAPDGAKTLMRLLTGSGSKILSLRTDRRGRLMFKNHAGSGTVKSSTTLALSGGPWHVIQLHASVNGSASLAELWLDGTQVSDLTWSTSLGTQPVGRLQLAHKGSSSGFQIAFDEVLVDTEFIGGGPPTAPATPANLRATSISASRVSLAWDPVIGADGYGVYRGGTLLQEVASASFDDLSVGPLQTYSYSVDAFKGTLRSALTAPIQVDTPDGTPGAEETLVRAAGDIACDPADQYFNGGEGTSTRCRQKYTAQLLAGSDAVFAIGDTQYFCGGTLAFQQSYDPTWGQYKAITYAAVADAEYDTVGTDCAPGAAGFYDYFGARGGAGTDGIYSFDLPEGCTPGEPGCWHVVVLNSVCNAAGGCGHGAPMDTWLQQDLAANQAAACTIGMLHIPRFASKASGINAVNDKVKDLWETMHAGGVDIVLSGNSHFYERFAPQDPMGQADPDGIVQFVVGTGGRSHGGLADEGSRLPNSQAGNKDAFGVLELALHDGGYDWDFLVEGSSTFTDSGTAACSA